MTGVRNAAACHCPFCFFLTEEENEKQCNKFIFKKLGMIFKMRIFAKLRLKTV